MRGTSAAHSTSTPNNETCLALKDFITIPEIEGDACPAPNSGGSVDTSTRTIRKRDTFQCIPKRDRDLSEHRKAESKANMANAI